MTEQQRRYERHVNSIIEEVKEQFPTLGGGKADSHNPIEIASRNQPLAFQAGIYVEELVRFITNRNIASFSELTKCPSSQQQNGNAPTVDK
jgi:hypothetical protein